MASRVIIVTGASRGIGLAVARDLIQASHKVVLVARSETELASLKKQHPSQVEYKVADLTKFEVAPTIVDLAVKTFGRLDGIVINHGVLSPMKRVADCNVDEWRQLFDANFFSAIALSKAVIPQLRQTKGRMVFVSSGASRHAYVSWGPYGSSKAALNSLAEHVAAEEPDITALSISPGRCDTSMQGELRELGKGAMADADHADFVKAFDDGRLNKPEWPAQVIAELSTTATAELSGKYLSWNAPELAQYRKQ